MIKRIVFFALIASVGSLFLGCAGPQQQSRLEMDYGTSHNLSKFNQILNPDAEKNLEPIEGLEGRAGQAAMQKYEKGFEKPAKEPRYIFSIGKE